jgi:hypothetical protein
MVLDLFHMQQIILNHHLVRSRDIYKIGEKEFNYQYFIDAHNS